MLLAQPATPTQPAQAPLPRAVDAGKGVESLPVTPGKKQEVFVLSRGAVVVQWPDSMSADDFQDIADWLPILERKIKRSVVKPGETTA